MAGFKYNPITQNLDLVNPDLTGVYLSLDQTTPQTIINGTPIIPSIDGSSAANGDLTLQGTSDATRTTSYVNLQPNGGNVGIGTIAPAALLNVNGIGLFGSTTLPGSASANSRLIIAKDDSNVGMDIIGSASGFPFVEFNRSRGTIATPLTIVDGDELGAFLFGGYDSTGTRWTAGVEAFADGTVSASAVPSRLTFSTGTTTSGVERMRITSGGNVGIETTSPSQRLTVSGTGADSTSGSLGIFNTSSGNGAVPQIYVQNNSNYYNQQLVWGSGNTGTRFGLIKANLAEITSSSPNFAVGTIGAYPLNFITNSVSSMTILSGGNVGIGTIAPTARLMIAAGTATAGTAPIKLVAGPVTTVAVAGQIEFDGTDWYLSI
jgi:hypothetical protein